MPRNLANPDGVADLGPITVKRIEESTYLAYLTFDVAARATGRTAAEAIGWLWIDYHDDVVAAYLKERGQTA